MQTILARLVREFINQRGAADFLDNYEDRRQELGSFLERAMQAEVGLDFYARIAVRHEDLLETFQVSSLSIPVQLENSGSETYTLTVSADLDVHSNPQMRMRAILNYPNLQTLPERIRQVIQTFCRDRVSLHQFYTSFADRGLRREMEQALQGLLEGEGRELKRLVLESETAHMQITLFLEWESSIRYQPHEAQEEITIRNDMQLELQDYGRYKQADSPDIKVWLSERLERTIKQALFGKTYLDILLDFQKPKDDIKSQMQDEVETIGYQLHHLVTKPELAENSLQELSSYTFNYEELPTNSAKITVSFQVVSTFSITDLKSISNLLNKSRNVQDVINLVATNLFILDERGCTGSHLAVS